MAIILCGTILFSCSSGEYENNGANAEEETGIAQEETVAEEVAEDDGLGVGPVTYVEVGDKIDQALVAEWQSIFESKCSACHQLSDQKVVGPELAGVTERRKSE